MGACHPNLANTQGNKALDSEPIETINSKVDTKELQALKLCNAGSEILHEMIKTMK